MIVLLLLSSAARAEPDESDYAPSEELLELLAMTGDDDAPVITPEQRAYFDSLPVRAKKLFDEAIEYEVMTEADHLGVLLGLELRPAQLELLLEDFCVVCHSDPWQEQKAVFSPDPEATGTPAHLNLSEFTNDVHFRRGVSCAGCHGGDPFDVVMTPATYQSMPRAPERHADRSWVPVFCGRCHSDPVYMRRFAPALPTDQEAKYRESQHGQLLLGQGDSKAAECVSCHGAHSIRAARTPRSSVHPQNIPAMCGSCHSDPEYMAGYSNARGEPLPTHQVERYESSVHGRALLERGDLGAPACNDCHGNHAAMPPEISSVSQVCRTCHSRNGELFDGSSHKLAFERKGWPECGTCHGTHGVQETSDDMLSEANGLCYACHAEHAVQNPDCDRGARYFAASITRLAHDTEELHEQIEPLAERGLDTEPLANVVASLRDDLRDARSLVHSFDPGEIEGVAQRGEGNVASARQIVEDAEEQYRFRRNGLLVAVGLMLALAVLLGLKIREMEMPEPPEGG